MIATLERCGMIDVAQGALADVAAKVTDALPGMANRVEADARALLESDIPLSVLRHRLWLRLARALAIDTSAPLSRISAQETTAAMAVRAAERLAPAFEARKESNVRKASDWQTRSRGLLAKLIKKAKSPAELFRAAPIPSFPEIVTAEFEDMLQCLGEMAETGAIADPKVAEALRAGRHAALAAMAGGGGWAAFAQVVAAHGFAPYILAAQASALVPFVGGPALVSFLAVITNPVTVLVGIGAIGWLGMGKAGATMRSQIAARFCALLAVQGTEAPEAGLSGFVADMRRAARAGRGQLRHAEPREIDELRRRLARAETALAGAAEVELVPLPDDWLSARRTTPTPKEHDTTDAMLVGGASAAELLYHAAAINPAVLTAAGFSRASEIEDPFDFAVHAVDWATRGAQFDLRGYTAEQMIMAHLIDAGHDVALAPESNTPGLDLVVDGAPVQVKCGESFSLLEDHFSKYPEIPVIANEELAREAHERGVAWADKVTTVEGFQLDVLDSMVQRALSGAEGIQAVDAMPYALALGVVRGGIEAWSGRIALARLPAWLATDLAVRGLLTKLGGEAGAAVGLIVIGPAGALVLGPAIGAAALLGTGHVKEAAIRRLFPGWWAELQSAAKELRTGLELMLERRLSAVAKRHERIVAASGALDSALRRWLLDRAADPVLAAVERKRQLPAPPSTVAEAVALEMLAARLAPADADVLRARANLRRVIAARPELGDAVRPLVDRLANVARQATAETDTRST
ncbi:MAG: hypothetical protein ACOCYW_04500 [Roseicyclus sp.]